MADVIIIGAGPTGCAAALALAGQGAQVMLTEAQPKAALRFAGEWMHPPGVRQLARLGIDVQKLSRSANNGFVIMAPGEQPIELPYARGHSLARVHHELVFELREIAAAHPRIEYKPGVAFKGLAANGGIILDHNGDIREHRPWRVIGADGRGSKVRTALNAPGEAYPISYMMGIELKDTRLPFEGLGHVIAGGPGPALLYRVDKETIRGCLDVPVWLGGDARKKEAVMEGFARVMPESLKQPFISAFQHATPWAATRFQPRTFFGRDNIWLAGDSVGHLHPVTGMGMTLGILDAAALAECSTLEEYASRRNNYIVELLTNVLYHVLQRDDESAVRVRRGLLAMLRNSPKDRLRTMRILTGEDENPVSFITAFAKATGTTLVGNGPLTMGNVATDLKWLKWPLSAALSQVTGSQALRLQSNFSAPFTDPKSLFKSGLTSLPARLRTSA